MIIVNHILKTKGHDVWTIGPDNTVFDAVSLMAEKKVGALVVVNKGHPVGMISETDYTRKVIVFQLSSKETQVKEIMTSNIMYTEPEQNIEECMALMTEKRIRHLPVWDGKELHGIISIGDLVKAIINDQRFIIEQLEKYISG